MVDVTAVWIRSIVGEGFAVSYEILHIPGGNGESEGLAAEDPHVGDTDHLAPRVEKRAPAVTGVDRRVGLYIGQTAEVSLGGRNDALGEGSFQAEWISDREYRLTDVELLRTLHRREKKLGPSGIGDSNQGQIKMVAVSYTHLTLPTN